MYWTRRDDGEWRQPGLRGLSPQAKVLYFAAYSYCSEYQNDGNLEQHDLDLLCGALGLACEPGESLPGVLVDAGLWEARDQGWRIPDYLEKAMSRAEIEARSATRSRAGKLGARARWGTRPDPSPIANAMANRWQTDGKPMADIDRDEDRDRDSSIPGGSGGAEAAQKAGPSPAVLPLGQTQPGRTERLVCQLLSILSEEGTDGARRSLSRIVLKFSDEGEEGLIQAAEGYVRWQEKAPPSSRHTDRIRGYEGNLSWRARKRAERHPGANGNGSRPLDAETLRYIEKADRQAARLREEGKLHG